MNIALFFLLLLLIINLLLFVVIKRLRFVLIKERQRCNIYKNYYELFNQWINNMYRDEFISEYLKMHNYKNIIIYGMGEIGKRLYEDIERANCDVNCYFVDKNLKYPYKDGVKLVKLTDISLAMAIDVIIITPMYAFNALESYIRKQIVDVPVISIADIVYFEK